MFNDMMAGVKEDVVGYVYHLEVQVEKAEPVVPKAVSDLLAGATKAARGAAAAAAASSGGAASGGGAEGAAARSAEPAESGAAEGEDADEPVDESGVVLRAKGLDDGPSERQLRYTSAEGNDVQDASTLSRAQRRQQARQQRGAAGAAARGTVQDKPEGAPQGAGQNRAQRRAKRRRR